MAGVNCIVDDANGKLTYDREAEDLRRLGKNAFQFNISQGSESDLATFQIVSGGRILREHQSQPYPKGALKVKSIDVNSVSCVVKLKKTSPVDLNQVFGK